VVAKMKTVSEKPGEEITGGEQAEEALERQRAYFQQLFDNSPDAIAWLDIDDRFVNVNKGFETLFGYRVEEIKGRFINEIIVPEDRMKEASALSRARFSNKMVRVETVRKRKDGSLVDVSIIGYPIRFGNETVGAYAIYTDITKRKRAEETLQAEKNKLQSIIDAMRSGLTIQDRDYNIIYQNEVVRTIFGDHLGEKCYRVYEGQERVCKGCPVEKAFRDGEPHTSERRVVMPTGEVAFWENTASPVRDARGEIVSCLEIARNITERKQTEEQLRESEERFRSIVENSQTGIMIIDDAYRFVYVNDELCRISGYSRNEVIGQDFRQFLDEESKKLVADRYLRRQRGEEVPSRYEFNFVHKDGQKRRVEISSSVIKDSAGRVRTVAQILDITERKRMEEALRESREELRKMFESVTDGISVVDLNGIITEANQRVVEMHGFASKDELLGKSAFELVAPCDHDKIAKNMRKAIKQGTVKGVEYTLLRADGTEFPGELSTSVLRDALGKAVGHITIARDITERKRMEEALRESEEFSSSLLSNSPNPILVINPDTSIRYVNPALEKLTGFTSAELIGKKPPYPWWAEGTYLKQSKLLKEGMRKGRKVVERLFQNKNGEQFWIEITSAPIGRHGGFGYYVANWVDITERKLAEEKENKLQQELYLARRLASIGELAAGVAHEINNPLTGVIGFSQRLLRRSASEEASRDLEIIYSEAQRAAKIVQNLLTFARRRQPKKKYSNINDIVQKTLELRAYELQTSNIELVTVLAPRLPKIMVDFPQIQEVFLNIILNAEQAMSEAYGGGKLTIKTRVVKDYVRISFADDGPGISPEHLDKVFDPFFTTRAEKGGTGLGLSACHGIVTEHGGKIYVRSKLGQGATFFVELPLSPVETAVGRRF